MRTTTPAQPPLQVVLGVAKLQADAPRHVVHPVAIAAERTSEPVRLRGVSQQEVRGPQEVPVVIVALRLAGDGVHLVGRRREQQHADIVVLVRVREELPGEGAGVVLSVEQMTEALELVQDHQVRLERRDAHQRQPAP